MRPNKPRTTGVGDLFRARLDQIINLKHELVQLAGGSIGIGSMARCALYSDNGRRDRDAVRHRAVAAQHIYGLSDEGVCRPSMTLTSSTSPARIFSSTNFRTSAPTSAIGGSGSAASSSSCWLRACAWRMRPARCAPATSNGSRWTPRSSPRRSHSRLTPSCCMRQSRGSIGWPTNAGCNCASRICASPNRAMMAGRNATPSVKRHHRQLRLLRTRLGLLIRDIRRKIAGQADLETVLEWPLARAEQIRSQQQRQRGWKLVFLPRPRSNASARAKPARPTNSG